MSYIPVLLSICGGYSGSMTGITPNRAPLTAPEIDADLLNLKGGVEEVNANVESLRSSRGVAGGVATLGSDGKVPAAQLAAFNGQLAFPASQNASSDPNTLDDYEEGTWTPTFANGGSCTYSDRIGVYRKVGNVCYVSGRLHLSSLGTASGSVFVVGLPFIPAVIETVLATWADGWASNALNVQAAVTASFGIAVARRVNEGVYISSSHSDLGAGFLLFTGYYFVD